jgi:hypothetical protein
VACAGKDKSAQKRSPRPTNVEIAAKKVSPSFDPDQFVRNSPIAMDEFLTLAYWNWSAERDRPVSRWSWKPFKPLKLRNLDSLCI